MEGVDVCAPPNIEPPRNHIYGHTRGYFPGLGSREELGVFGSLETELTEEKTRSRSRGRSKKTGAGAAKIVRLWLLMVKSRRKLNI